MFCFQYVPKYREPLREDCYFCLRAGAHGFDVWIDHDLSQEIKHVGTFGYGHRCVEPGLAAELRKALA